MKKLMFWFAQAILLVSSAALSFSLSGEMAMGISSLMIAGGLMMLVVGFTEKKYLIYTPFWLMIAFLHGFYVFSSFNFSFWLLISGLCLGMIGDLALIWAMHKPDNGESLMLLASICKLCLIPEIFINYQLSKIEGGQIFGVLSWIFLLMTSLIAWAGITLLYRQKAMNKTESIICALGEVFFFTDLLASIFACVMAHRFTPIKEPKKSPLYRSKSFEKQKAVKKKKNS